MNQKNSKKIRKSIKKYGLNKGGFVINKEGSITASIKFIIPLKSSD